MRGSGSPGSRQLLPRSLMQRLMLLADGQLTPVASAGAEQPRRQRGRLSTLIFFGIGALTSSLLGGMTLIGLRALNAGEAVAAVQPAASAPDVVDVAIERGERERTAVGVRVEGAAEDADIEVVLRGVPATARLSKGERRDALTWVVKRAELDGLYMTLGEAGPDAFDMRIDVLVPSGVARQAGVVRVRLVDAPPQKQASIQPTQEGPRVETAPSEAQDKAAPAETTIAKLPAPAPVAERTAPDAKVASAPPAQRRANANPAGGKTTSAARPWPEGASGLGAVSRDSDSRDSERQVWWNVPPPWQPALF
jgi:hypothetical protein